MQEGRIEEKSTGCPLIRLGHDEARINGRGFSDNRCPTATHCDITIDGSVVMNGDVVGIDGGVRGCWNDDVGAADDHGADGNCSCVYADDDVGVSVSDEGGIGCRPLAPHPAPPAPHPEDIREDKGGGRVHAEGGGTRTGCHEGQVRRRGAPTCSNSIGTNGRDNDDIEGANGGWDVRRNGGRHRQQLHGWHDSNTKVDSVRIGSRCRRTEERVKLDVLAPPKTENTVATREPLMMSVAVPLAVFSRTLTLLTVCSSDSEQCSANGEKRIELYADGAAQPGRTELSTEEAIAIIAAT